MKLTAEELVKKAWESWGTISFSTIEIDKRIEYEFIAHMIVTALELAEEERAAKSRCFSCDALLEDCDCDGESSQSQNIAGTATDGEHRRQGAPLDFDLQRRKAEAFDSIKQISDILNQQSWGAAYGELIEELKELGASDLFKGLRKKLALLTAIEKVKEG